MSKAPESSTRSRSHRCAKQRAYAAATAGDSTAATTFSCRVQESSVQFIEPVQTLCAVAHAELVVHEVAPAGDRLHRHAERLEHVRLGARRGGEERPLDVLRRALVLVVGDPDGHPARGGGADRVGHPVADRAGQAHVVEGEVERSARGLEPREQPVGDVVGRLPAIGEGPRLQHGGRPYPLRGVAAATGPRPAGTR